MRAARLLLGHFRVQARPPRGPAVVLPREHRRLFLCSGRWRRRRRAEEREGCAGHTSAGAAATARAPTLAHPLCVGAPQTPPPHPPLHAQALGPCWMLSWSCRHRRSPSWAPTLRAWGSRWRASPPTSCASSSSTPTRRGGRCRAGSLAAARGWRRARRASAARPARSDSSTASRPLAFGCCVPRRAAAAASLAGRAKTSPRGASCLTPRGCG